MKLIFSTFSFLWFSLAYLSECEVSCYPAFYNDTFTDLNTHQEERSIMGSEILRINYQEDTAAILQLSFYLLLYLMLQFNQSRDFCLSLTTSPDTSQHTTSETLSISLSNNILMNLIVHKHQGSSSTELMDTEKHEMKYKRTLKAPGNHFFLLPPSASRFLCTALSPL